VCRVSEHNREVGTCVDFDFEVEEPPSSPSTYNELACDARAPDGPGTDYVRALEDVGNRLYGGELVAGAEERAERLRNDREQVERMRLAMNQAPAALAAQRAAEESQEATELLLEQLQRIRPQPAAAGSGVGGLEFEPNRFRTVLEALLASYDQGIVVVQKEEDGDGYVAHEAYTRLEVNIEPDLSEDGRARDGRYYISEDEIRWVVAEEADLVEEADLAEEADLVEEADLAEAADLAEEADFRDKDHRLKAAEDVSRVFQVADQVALDAAIVSSMAQKALLPLALVLDEPGELPLDDFGHVDTEKLDERISSANYLANRANGAIGEAHALTQEWQEVRSDETSIVDFADDHPELLAAVLLGNPELVSHECARQRAASRLRADWLDRLTNTVVGGAAALVVMTILFSFAPALAGAWAAVAVGVAGAVGLALFLSARRNAELARLNELTVNFHLDTEPHPNILEDIERDGLTAFEAAQRWRAAT
jgi:hypothetical protein